MNTKKMKINVIPTIVIISLIILFIAGSIYGFQEEKPVIEGQADVTEYRISSKVPGRIKKILVKEGDFVKAGDTLAVLEAPEVLAKLEQAQAMTSAAVAQNKKADTGAQLEQKQAAYDLWQKAIVGLRIAEQSYTRVKKLADEGVISAQKLDEVTAQRDAAIQTEKIAKSQYEMAIKGTRIEDKQAAAAMVKRAKGAVKEVDSYLNEMYLTASEDGQVSDIYPVVGELLGPGAPVMSVSLMKDLWISFNVREDLLKDFSENKEITVYVPALNKNIKTKVFYIKNLGTYAVWKATKPTGEYDMKTFEVKVRPLKHIEGLLPGMSIIYKK